ncbi:MAG TPA: CaiB/BaiF CoA-transferase family protein [Acidimicrobiia bacterium]|nr:CaiB/BaiF CoA-transferase family protein [Acidimicrobiia bacterium]
MADGTSSGPLGGIRVLDLGGIGPPTFAGMVLADLGADVVRVDRVGAVSDERRSSDFLLRRGARSIAVDVRSAGGLETLLRLVEAADVLIEGWRPGVAERLGIGPDACLERNPRLIYVRATGWGQDGPYAQAPGHDINYLATTGVLHAIGREGSPPAPPLNLVGDYGGGGMLCLVGILSAVLETQRSGQGQVIDASMLDGVALLSTLQFGQRHLGEIDDGRESNRLDGGAPWYDTYETADGRFVAVAAGEPQFFKALLDLLGLDEDFGDPLDPAAWPAMRKAFTVAFAGFTRAELEARVGDPALCLSPVLTWGEAPQDRHNQARGVYVEHDGVLQPAPAPRFSRTPAAIRRPPPWPGEQTTEALQDWGIPAADVERLLADGAVRQR